MDTAFVGRFHRLQQLEISLATHFGGAQQIPNNEHGNFIIGRDDDRALHAGLGVNDMITALAAECEILDARTL